jgi:hypothetical protein
MDTGVQIMAELPDEVLSWITKFEDKELGKSTGKYEFDVIAFDDYLHEVFGYREMMHGSIQQFVKDKWGKDSCNFAYDLIMGVTPASKPQN